LYHMTAFSCPQCGAPIEVTPRISFHTCRYCNTTSFIDRSGVMFYYLTPFMVDEKQARLIFSRWLKNPHMAKNLDIKANILNFKKVLFPVYRFLRMIDGKEVIFIRPARGTLIEGMQDLIIPPGSMKLYDNSAHTSDATRIDPDITMDIYLSSLPGAGVEQSLVYFPLYEAEYEFNDEIWHAVIDGSSGAVHATTYPMRSSLPFGLIFFIAFMAGILGIILGLYIHLIFFILIPAGFLASRRMAGSVVGKGGRTRMEG